MPIETHVTHDEALAIVALARAAAGDPTASVTPIWWNGAADDEEIDCKVEVKAANGSAIYRIRLAPSTK